VHQEKALWPIQNGGEAAALFCWGFLVVAVFGAGSWSLDRLLATRRPTTQLPAPRPAVDRVTGPETYLARRKLTASRS
jgi:putative oxidoreductase